MFEKNNKNLVIIILGKKNKPILIQLIMNL